MTASISVISRDDAQQRTKVLVSELLDIIPGITEGVEDSEVTIRITEDVGPQFITFQSSKQQFVFKIIEFRSREDLGIPRSIKKESSQLVLSNFTTDVGLGVAQFFMEVFPISLESNQVINFTVHKDFVYFRMYRFCIKDKGPVMEKIGPHLTLRLWRTTEYIGEEKKTCDFKKYIKNRNLL